MSKSARKHYDVTQWIQQLRKKGGRTWEYLHVNGHQDDLKSHNELNRYEVVNIEADRSTKQSMTVVLNHDDPNQRNIHHIVKGGYSIWWNDRHGHVQVISNHLQKTLAHHLKSAEIREYWSKKGKFSRNLDRQIDWDHLHKSLRGVN